MARYAKPVAVDKNGNPLDSQPLPLKAITTVVSENATVSSVITLNDNTTDIEISGVGAPVVIRWVPRTDTQASVLNAAGTANYDSMIAANGIRRFIVPIETIGTSSLVGANIANGLYNRIAWKSIGSVTGSILSTQY